MSMVSGHRFDPKILREYDVRGVVGETLFEADARALGQAYATLVRQEGGGTICVGWDGRLSTPTLRDALIDGLTDTGIRVRKVGLGPTPMLNFSVHHTGADAGVMVTGSHNPGTHNGFKMSFGPECGGGRPVFGAEIQQMGAWAEAGIAPAPGGTVEDVSVRDAYVERLIDELDGTSLDGQTVVWDCGNGAAGDVVQQLTGRLPGVHHVLFPDIDGTFPNHHPDPTVAANLTDLQDAVLACGADLGVAFDGDGDRLGVVDDAGGILWADQVMVYFAADLLNDSPGSPLIADVKASQVFFDECRRLGGAPEMFKTGHSLIKSRMKETGAPMAGEMSGHLFFKDRYYGFDDALYAAMRLLRIKASNPRPLSAFRQSLPPVFNTPELRIDVSDDLKFGVIERLKSRLDAEGVVYNPIDGIRAQTDDGWWLLRASNTQAALVARCEASSQEGLQRLLDELRRTLASEDVVLSDV